MLIDLGLIRQHQFFRETKVSNLEKVVVHEYVFGLQVPVDNVVGV